MTPRRHLVRFVAAACLALAVFAVTGCSDTLQDAATVNDTHISRSDFTNELDDLVGNDQFVKLLKENGGFTTAKNGETVDARLAATWLSLLVQQVAIDQEFESRHLKVTPQDTAAAKSSIEQNFGGAQVVNAFPKSFRDELIARQAKLVAIGNDLTVDVKAPTVEDARVYYEQNREALFACPSAKTVKHIVVATEAEANDVLSQLQGGADFATLAQQRSTDTTTRQQGGVISSAQGPIGCYTAGSSPQLDDAVNGATPGTPTGPVQTQSGYEVVEVSPYAVPAFEDVQEQLVQLLQQQAVQSAAADRNTELTRVLARRLRGYDVRVDPRYGRWIVDAQGPRVDPPRSPEVRETRNKTVQPPALDQLGGQTPQTAPSSPSTTAPGG
jgi:parvulin-like peptidyl-prolyl isomerase